MGRDHSGAIDDIQLVLTMPAGCRRVSAVVGAVLELTVHLRCVSFRETALKIALHEALFNALRPDGSGSDSPAVVCSVIGRNERLQIIVRNPSLPVAKNTLAEDAAPDATLDYADPAPSLAVIARLVDEIQLKDGGREVHFALVEQGGS